MYDLPNTVKTSRVACYADDTKIFKSIDSITDCSALQSDLNDLISWSESPGLMDPPFWIGSMDHLMDRARGPPVMDRVLAPLKKRIKKEK